MTFAAARLPGSFRPHSLQVAVLLSCALAHASGLAQSAAPTTLDRVEISGTPGSGNRLNRDQIAAPVQTATDADLQRSGAQSLADFLQRLGSVHLNDMQGNPLQADVSYRGFTASPLLGTPQGLSLYVDGVRQNQPFGDTVNWDLIPRSAIASMSLMPGSNPLFGLNTLGGALAVKTKDGLSHPGSAVQFDVGSHGRRNLELDVGGSNREGWDWFGTARSFRESGWRDDSPSNMNQLFGKLGWRDGPTRLSLSLAHADTALTGNGLQEQRLLDSSWSSVYTKPDTTHNHSNGATFEFSHALTPERTLSGNVYLRGMTSRTLNGDVNGGSLNQSVYTLSAADKAALTAAGIAYPATINAANTPFPYLRCIAQALQGDEPGEKCNGLLNYGQSVQENGGFNLQVSGRKAVEGMEHRYAVGTAWDASRVAYQQSTQLGYLNADRSVTGVNAWADGVSGGNVDGVPLDNRVDMTSRSRTASLFGTDTVTLSPGLHLTLSGRYNRTHVVNEDRIHPGGGSDSLDGDHTFSRFNPALGLTWALSSAVGGYVGYAQSSRAPTAIELGCANPEQPCKLPNAMAGDPPLRQVVTQTAEIGLRGRLDGGRTEWHVGAFRADNRDDILFVADNQAGYGYFKNFGQTRRQGIEMSGSTKLSEWRLSAAYTWLDATFRSAETVNGSANSSNSSGGGLEGTIDIRPGDRIPLIPRQQLKLAVAWMPAPEVEVEVSGVGVSSSLARGNENGAHEADGNLYLGSGRNPGYAVFNLSTSWQPTSALKVFASVMNLADRRYTTAAQLGSAAFNSNGAYQARAYGGSAAAGYPVQSSTFYSPGAPRSFGIGLRYDFSEL